VNHIVVFRDVLLVDIVFAAEILDLKMGLEETVEGLLLVQLVLNLK